MAKNSWFEDSPLNKKLEWRQAVSRGWIGARADQVKLPGMDYSTVMKVPSSKGGRLIRALAAAEPRLAKSYSEFFPPLIYIDLASNDLLIETKC